MRKCIVHGRSLEEIEKEGDEDATAKVGLAREGPVAQLKEGITFKIHIPQEFPIRGQLP